MMKQLFAPFAIAVVSFLNFTGLRQAAAQSYCIPRDTMMNSQEGINAVQALLAYENLNNANSGVDSTGYGNFMYDSVIVKRSDSFILQTNATLDSLHWAVCG